MLFICLIFEKLLSFCENIQIQNFVARLPQKNTFKPQNVPFEQYYNS